jgi:hypothetical protein
MYVDETRRNRKSGSIDRASRRSRPEAAHGGDPALPYRNIGNKPGTPRSVHNPSIADQQIEILSPSQRAKQRPSKTSEHQKQSPNRALY